MQDYEWTAVLGMQTQISTHLQSKLPETQPVLVVVADVGLLQPEGHTGTTTHQQHNQTMYLQPN